MVVTAICSAKGGVGKTTITANLGCALARYFCYKTLIVDANITTASLSLHFGLTSFPSKFLNLLTQDTFDQVIYQFDNNLDIIPAPLMNLAYIKPKSMQWLKKLKYDFVLIDSAPGIESESKAAIKAAQKVLIVTTPDLPSVTGVIKTVALSEKMEKEIIGVVVNMVQGKQPELTKKDIESILGYNVIAKLPYEKIMAECVIVQKPLILKKPFCKFSQSIKKLAGQISGFDYKPSLVEKLKAIFW
jgi:septum site-determining protein MinD